VGPRGTPGRRGCLTDALKVTPAVGFTLAEDLTSSHRARVEPVRHSSTDKGGVLDVCPKPPRCSPSPGELDKLPGREQRVAWGLAPLDGDYDQVLIDCPPHPGRRHPRQPGEKLPQWTWP
jgi:chromosome partitioning protein